MAASLSDVCSQFFHLSETPFTIAPNPKYLFLSSQHREALAHLLYGINEGGGFTVLTGEVGTGKTTLCRALLDDPPEGVDIALIFNPCLNAQELVAAICDELRVPYSTPVVSMKSLIDTLNSYLLAAHANGRRPIVLIDEAQNLRMEVLEQIRLLTNLETNHAKLIQIILVGQPELNDMLAKPTLRQLSQRITARYHLHPLSHEETGAYICHRLNVAGGTDDVFTSSAIRTIYRISHGIPRLINLISERALIAAYSKKVKTVDSAMAKNAALEFSLQDRVPLSPRKKSLYVSAALAFGFVLFALVLGFTDIGGPYLSRLWESPLFKIDLSSPKNPEPNVVLSNNDDTSRTSPLPDEITETTEVASKRFNDWLLQNALPRKEAFSMLFGVWNVNSDGRKGECKARPVNGVQCSLYEGSWRGLTRLNHPAILRLQGVDGKIANVLLIKLGVESATLKGLEGEFVVNTNQLIAAWTGKADVLWRSSLDHRFGTILPGETSPVISWVRIQLSVPPGARGVDYFDHELKDKLIEFQRTSDLKQSGTVDDWTMVALENAGDDEGVPRLKALGVQ